MEKLSKIDASPEAKGLERDLRADSPKTAEEFDVLISRYKEQCVRQNQLAKFEAKLGSGEFSKQALALGITWPKAEAKVEKEEKEVKPKKEVKE